MSLSKPIVNESVFVRASSNFALQRGRKALPLFKGFVRYGLSDCVNLDLRQQCDRSHSSVEGNLINELPDHILVSILSRLDLKEAARTAVLSHRWRNLWKFTTRLVFDNSLLVWAILRGDLVKSLQVERSRFINWVNNALESYQGTSLDEFKVCFDVDEESCKLDIDGWIIFALEKRVQRLHLDFSRSSTYFSYGSYTLTTQFLSNYSISSLKVLRLVSVEVTSEVVEYMLSMCPLLEALVVKGSDSLSHIKVYDPSLKLKSLEILYCSNLKYIEISSTNLVSFAYGGQKIVAAINNVPHLVEASFSGECAGLLARNMFIFSELVSQLQVLELDLEGEGRRTFRNCPKLKNLKHLELRVSGDTAPSLLSCANLLKVSPLLHRFTLKVSGLADSKIYRPVKEKEIKKLHPHLKVIEFSGFVGRIVDVELLLCLLKRASSLKKLVIEPCTHYFFEKRIECKDSELLRKARTRAKQLETRLPPGAELVIL
ncbi:hypothetical protein CCACVL1_12006 [Corchorus capsularis]|uniref:F-box domain-containing protein n=1 Tax=Corchorus capsularis TaxID=210143 RepID=A0A1R3II68_COCAP|nr:hypothetical protein CCACVL1_12006 [Corchorus capsularis]